MVIIPWGNPAKQNEQNDQLIPMLGWQILGRDMKISGLWH